MLISIMPHVNMGKTFNTFNEITSFYLQVMSGCLIGDEKIA